MLYNSGQSAIAGKSQCIKTHTWRHTHTHTHKRKALDVYQVCNVSAVGALIKNNEVLLCAYLVKALGVSEAFSPTPLHLCGVTSGH